MRCDYSTRAQLLARLRERYKAASGDEAAKIGAFLADATVAELRAAFGGLSAAQANALRTRLGQQKAAREAVRAVRGE